MMQKVRTHDHAQIFHFMSLVFRTLWHTNFKAKKNACGKVQNLDVAKLCQGYVAAQMFENIFSAQVLFDTNDDENQNIHEHDQEQNLHWMNKLAFETDWCTTFTTINFCVWKSSKLRCCKNLLWLCCRADVRKYFHHRLVRHK